MKSGSSAPIAGPVGKSFVSGDRLVGGSGPCGCVMRFPSAAVHALGFGELDDVPATAMHFPKLPTGEYVLRIARPSSRPARRR